MQTANDSFQEAPEERERLQAAYRRLLPDSLPVEERAEPGADILSESAERVFAESPGPSHDMDRADAVPPGNPDDPDPRQKWDDALEHESPTSRDGPVADLSRDTPALDIHMLAHDLRAPLASAKLSLEVMRDSRVTPESRDKAFDLAQKSLQALDAIIESLAGPITIACPTSRLDLRSHVPRELISTAMDQVTPLAAEKNLQLTIGSVLAPPSLLCDGVGIIRVLVNLLSNAIKAVHAGSRIVIEAHLRNNDGHPVIVFSVIDEGPGVTRDLAERIFDVGVSIAHSGKPSTGLGLAICRKIVEAHQGRIWVEIDRTHGATFSFAIPLDLGHAETRDVPHTPRSL